jgi:hypothetical protein
MRKVKSEDETRDEIKNWLEARAPEWFKDVTDSELFLLIINLMALKDVKLACFYVQRTTGKKADEDLVHILLQDWNEYAIADLLEKGVIEEVPHEI